MRNEVEVLKPGLYSSIQDMGRPGYLKYGVPLSGAMDSYSAGLANLSLQNPQNSAVLEITQMGPKLRFFSATEIVLFGANLSPIINAIPIKNNKVLQIKSGDELSFGRRSEGCRCYLAISGGFKTEMVFESYSWYEGITAQFKLEKGMVLAYGPAIKKSHNEVNSAIKVDARHLNSSTIETFPGPEFKLLPKNLKSKLWTRQFTIGKKNNRMAIQLRESLKNDLGSILTGPVLPGTVQLTPSGNLIVLMRDCQTTGGYPRILQLTEAGINCLAQKIMGDNIKFELKSYT